MCCAVRALRCALWGLGFGALGKLGLNPEAVAAWSSQPQGFAVVPACFVAAAVIWVAEGRRCPCLASQATLPTWVVSELAGFPEQLALCV